MQKIYFLFLAALALLFAMPLTFAATSYAVSISSSPTLGNYLVNSNGFTLYLYKGDTRNSGTSSCTSSCAAFWPPFYASNLTVSSGLSTSNFTTITRSGGAMQLAYNGWPLYTYAQDSAAGQTNGQGVGGVWYIVAPLALQTPTPTTTAPPTTTISSSGSTPTTLPTTIATTIATTIPTTIPQASVFYGPAMSLAMICATLLLIVLLAAIYLVLKWKSPMTRLIVIGTALILIGTIVWLYGDYAGGIFSYIIGGTLLLLLGIILWLVGDIRGGTFKNAKAGRLVMIGVILLLLGTAIWLYGDFKVGTSLYIWGGVALILAGTIIWLYANKTVGAFTSARK